jgi:hypothetical protein
VSGLVAGALGGALVGLVGAGLVRLAIDPGSRPMVVGILIWGVVAGIAGLIAGARTGGLRGALGIGAAALVAGGLLGAFTAITFTWHVAVAIGIAVFLALAPAIAGAFAARRIDPRRSRHATGRRPPSTPRRRPSVGEGTMPGARRP